MINRTKWQPDTCGCSFTYEWDTEAKEEDRVHTCVECEPCEHHLHLDDQEACFEAVKAENVGKNTVLGEVKKQLPELDVSQLEYTFDADRNLSIKVDSLDAEKASVIDSIVAELSKK